MKKIDPTGITVVILMILLGLLLSVIAIGFFNISPK